MGKDERLNRKVYRLNLSSSKFRAKIRYLVAFPFSQSILRDILWLCTVLLGVLSIVQGLPFLGCVPFRPLPATILTARLWVKEQT